MSGPGSSTPGVRRLAVEDERAIGFRVRPVSYLGKKAASKRCARGGIVGRKHTGRDEAIAKLIRRTAESSRRPLVRLCRVRAVERSGVGFMMHSAEGGMKKRRFAGTIAVDQVMRLI